MQCPRGRTVQQPSNTGRSSAVQRFISVQFSSSSTLAKPQQSFNCGLILLIWWFIFFLNDLNRGRIWRRWEGRVQNRHFSAPCAVRAWQSILLSFTFFLSFLRTTASAVGGRAVDKASEPPPSTSITIDFLGAWEAERGLLALLRICVICNKTIVRAAFFTPSARSAHVAITCVRSVDGLLAPAPAGAGCVQLNASRWETCKCTLSNMNAPTPRPPSARGCARWWKRAEFKKKVGTPQTGTRTSPPDFFFLIVPTSKHCGLCKTPTHKSLLFLIG